jgi:hypothetical protein
MVKNLFKLFLVLFFIFGIIGISIIKNISVQKKNYITQLQLELYKQQETFDIYKIEWDHLISPINLGSKINSYTLESYNKTFVVINEEIFTPKYQNELDEMLNINTLTVNKNVGR